MAKSPLTREDREKVLKQKLQSIGVGPIQFRDGGTYTPLEFMSTGQPEIDDILGVGAGIPRGTVVEFCGESMSGKTYLSYKVMASAQKQGEWVCYANVENSFYPPRAESLGVKVDDPISFKLMENIATAEEYGEAIYALVESGLFGVIVVDSISSLIPETEYEKSLSDPSTIGAHARFVKRFVRKLLVMCQSTGTIVILINQTYMGAGAFPGAPMVQTATGGNAMNFYPHMRLWFKRINGANGKILNAANEVVGGKSKITLMKTRYSEPWVETEFPILFGDAESDPVAEFIFRAKARSNEYIKEVRKKYIYTHPDTGEVIESKNPVEFIKLLSTTPAPEKRVRGDESATVLQYVCGRLKMTNTQMENLIKVCDNTKEVSEDISEEDNE